MQCVTTASTYRFPEDECIGIAGSYVLMNQVVIGHKVLLAGDSGQQPEDVRVKVSREGFVDDFVTQDRTFALESTTDFFVESSVILQHPVAIFVIPLKTLGDDLGEVAALPI